MPEKSRFAPNTPDPLCVNYTRHLMCFARNGSIQRSPHPWHRLALKFGIFIFDRNSNTCPKNRAIMNLLNTTKIKQDYYCSSLYICHTKAMTTLSGVRGGGAAKIQGKLNLLKNVGRWKIFQYSKKFQGKRRLFKILNDKKYIFNTVNSVHTLFFRASTSCSKILNVKTIFNTVKYFRKNWKNSVFRASASSSKIVISMQWKFSGQTLFFRASPSCSKFWRIKSTFNTVNSGHTLVFRASKTCSNILNVKSILNTAKNVMTNSVFRASASSSKILKDKNISMQWKISGQTLFFRACASCSKFGMIKYIYIQNSEFRAHSVFQGNPQVAQKSWRMKNSSSQ